jgi:uridine kinase
MAVSDVFIIGIAGASGCGKTYFANMLKEKVGSSGVESIEIISCDNYYKPYPGGVKAPDDFNWDVPEVLELELLEQHLRDLKNGLMINVPKYDFLTSQRFVEPDKVVDGSKVKVVIVEGLFVLMIESLRSLFNLKLFTWLDADICLARRLVRDVKERGYSYEHTIHQYQTQVKPTYVNFIEPTKKYADLIISSSEYTDNKVGLEVICSYVKRLS